MTIQRINLTCSFFKCVNLILVAGVKRVDLGSNRVRLTMSSESAYPSRTPPCSWLQKSPKKVFAASKLGKYVGSRKI